MKKLFLLLITVGSLGACQQAKDQNKEDNTEKFSSSRIITAGGTITEIVAALGFQEQIIATDITSTYPEEMQQLPSIGYRNQIKAEGLISLNPDVIVYEEGYLSNEVIEQIKESGIQVHGFEKPKQIESTRKLINDLGKLFGAEKGAEYLLGALKKDEDTLKELLKGNSNRPGVSFVMARGPETVFLSGHNTFARYFIELAGCTSLHLEAEDFKALSPEALPAINPDYVLLFDSSIRTMGGMEGLGNIQGMQETDAWKNQAIITMDGNLISGFGPRIVQAAIQLFEKTHQE
jgi:iron complex transport system substrate-binding protein